MFDSKSRELAEHFVGNPYPETDGSTAARVQRNRIHRLAQAIQDTVDAWIEEYPEGSPEDAVMPPVADIPGAWW